MKALITHPDLNDPGGVAAYVAKLQDKFAIPMAHCIIGTRPGRAESRLGLPFRMAADYYRFVKLLGSREYEIVHVNPSLRPKSILRDGILVLLGKLHHKKIVVFFHGWDKSLEASIQRHGQWLFKLLYGRADSFIVLANDFKAALERWGIDRQIHCEVMTIGDELLEGFDIHGAITHRSAAEKWRILFLSRILREKGIYETVDAFEMLCKKYPMLELVVAGDGPELPRVRAYVEQRAIANVNFTGYVTGDHKLDLLKTCHALCFPSYSEGFPNTLVEAMAFGLPVVTRRVGGIGDFFINGEHGFATDSKSPEIIAGYLEQLYADRQLWRRIALANFQYAQTHFLASRTALRLEEIYSAACR